MTVADDLARVRALRAAYWTNQYRPLAIWSQGALDRNGEAITGAGKRPVGEDWRQRALRDPPDAVTAAVSSAALNTGILTHEIVAPDIDVPVANPADLVVHRIEQMLSPTPFNCVGLAPKMLLVYRVEGVFAKISTRPLLLPDGTKVQVEVLGEGQQFVADGIHPDTLQP
jgi:hypothetical protein